MKIKYKFVNEDMIYSKEYMPTVTVPPVVSSWLDITDTTGIYWNLGYGSLVYDVYGNSYITPDSEMGLMLSTMYPTITFWDTITSFKIRITVDDATILSILDRTDAQIWFGNYPSAGTYISDIILAPSLVYKLESNITTANISKIEILIQ